MTLLAAGYACVALVAAAAFLMRPRITPEGRRPVSVLKPLCGLEPRLYENLRSFCVQDYPDFQLVFGVRDAADPAIAVVRQLQQEFSSLSIDLAVDPQLHGANYKVSNLINILAHCRHECLVLADSDICVGPDYLAEVVAPLGDPAVGVVTCIYRGRASSSVWSRLGTLFIDDWFAPSVWVTHLFGSRAFAFGATIALRRETLAAAGGFGAIADQVADDFWLGELTRRSGLRTVLSTYQVTTDVIEADLASLFDHELRWLRVIRSIQPLGFALCFITFGIPVASAGCLAASGGLTAKLGLGATLAARLALHVLQRARAGGSILSEAWLILPRDFLSLAVWCSSFASQQIRWGGRQFVLGREGVINEIG